MTLESEALDPRYRTHLRLAEANEQLKQSLAKIHAKEATKSDSLRAVIQVGNAQLAILTARHSRTRGNPPWASRLRRWSPAHTGTAACTPSRGPTLPKSRFRADYLPHGEP